MKMMQYLATAILIPFGVVGTVVLAQTMNDQAPVSEPFTEPALNSVCHLFIRRRVMWIGTPEYTGSAVLYRGRYLLTAGHNVYQDRSKIRNVEVRCGTASARSAAIDEQIEPWQALDASGYRGKPFSRDFGIIRLNRPIVVTDPFALAETPVQPGDPVRFAGYPGGPHDGWSLFAADGKITKLSTGLAHYDIATFKSNSGGPVWRMVEGKPQLVAIHVTNGAGRIIDADYRTEIDRLIKILDQQAAENRP